MDPQLDGRRFLQSYFLAGRKDTWKWLKLILKPSAIPTVKN